MAVWPSGSSSQLSSGAFFAKVWPVNDAGSGSVCVDRDTMFVVVSVVNFARVSASVDSEQKEVLVLQDVEELREKGGTLLAIKVPNAAP